MGIEILIVERTCSISQASTKESRVFFARWSQDNICWRPINNQALRWNLHTSVISVVLNRGAYQTHPGKPFKTLIPRTHTRLMKSGPLGIGDRTWHQCVLNINISIYKYNINISGFKGFPGDFNMQSGFWITVHLIFSAKSMHLHCSVPILFMRTANQWR